MPERILAKHESEVPALKTVGIIGGMGQWATLDIMRRILKNAVAYPIPQYGNRGYPAMELRMLNRAPMLLNADGSYPDKLEPSEFLLDAARSVGALADFIIVTSNTAHVFAKEIEAAAGKPLLSLIDVAVAEAVRKNFRKVGIMAIGVTIREGLFQKPLAAAGIESIVLPEALGKRLDDEGVYPVQEGAEPSEHSTVAFEAIEFLKSQGAEAVILGCTEIPLLLGEAADAERIINPSELIARAVIERALA